MHDIERLIQEHKAMDELAQDLLALVERPEPRVEEAFSLVRRLSACLDEHLAAEQGFLYANHLAAALGRLDEEVVAFERAFADLKEEWALYLLEWTPENIGIDWRNFAHATGWVIRRLRERIAQENDILYPLALQQCRIRLRPAARA
jgi:hypothetical protein